LLAQRLVILPLTTCAKSWHKVPGSWDSLWRGTMKKIKVVKVVKKSAKDKKIALVGTW
jgi:hypothetical protein